MFRLGVNTVKCLVGIGLCCGQLTSAARAQKPWGWWPDTDHNVSVWVSYSNEYKPLWSHHDQAQKAVDAMAKQGVKVVFLAFSSSASKPHVQSLSNRSDPFTADVQYAINRLAARKIATCASILSDNFTGSRNESATYVLVDHLLDFNVSRGRGDGGFNCVSTDLEMAAGSQTIAIFDRWKQFHLNMRDRITSAGGGLQLLAWVQGPDYLMAQMPVSERAQLMKRENITQDTSDPTLYEGALRYFTMQTGSPIFDAVIPMWYFTPTGPYYRRVDHNIRELQSIGASNLYLIPGLMVQDGNDGTCCSGCVSGRADYESRLAYNDTVRAQFPNLIGAGVFLWPIDRNWTCP